jgi:hypothetical protein
MEGSGASEACYVNFTTNVVRPRLLRFTRNDDKGKDYKNDLFLPFGKGLSPSHLIVNAHQVEIHPSEIDQSLGHLFLNIISCLAQDKRCLSILHPYFL